jgi:hypothetical protein
MFGGMMPDVVDRGHSSFINMPEKYAVNRDINWAGVKETAKNLRTFKHRSNIAFGHIAYMPEYAKVLKETNTLVLFNIRDPRDVVIAEYYSAMRHLRESRKARPLWDFYDKEAGMNIFDKPDPIIDLIIFAATRWPRWLGWMDHDFVKVVKYEDLRLRTHETCQEIFKWAKPVGILNARALAKGTKPNPTFRRGQPREWAKKFKPHHTELAKELLSEIIKRMGYEW